MPLQTGKKQGQCYIKWGDQGHEYFYICDSTRSYEYAKNKALAQAAAIGEYNLQESYTDYPEAASENAKIALRWADENGWGSCGTAVGKARANQLANKEPISRDTIARMSAFERHRQYSDKELGDGCGRLMWLAWGGDEGVEWAQRKLKEIDSEVDMVKPLTFMEILRQIINK
jgi:hypothetical protein